MLRLPAINRRWIQGSLRGFLVAIAVLAAGFAWYGARLRREARIDNAVRLVAASPTRIYSVEPDQIAIVRAVNALQALGKRDAIEALRRFEKHCDIPFDASTFEEDNVIRESYQALRPIIPLLFERDDPTKPYPIEARGDKKGTYRYPSGRWDEGWDEWRVFPLYYVVEGDIPFQTAPARGTGVHDANFTHVINWAEEHGRLRTRPLRPTDNPFEAADRALETHKAECDQEFVRDQVFRAIAHLLPPEERDRYDYDKAGSRERWRNLDDDNQWEYLKDVIGRMKIRWSPERQTYVATQYEL